MATANSQPTVNQNQNQTMSTADANAFRIIKVTYRIQQIFSSNSKSSDDLHKLLITLARCIDYALSIDQIPKIPLQVLLPTLRQVYERRNEETLQPSIALLMIAVKNACRNEWFCSGDRDELLIMSNELLMSFCMGNSSTIDENNAVNTISMLIPRFYPQFKLGRMLLSFEVKPGFHAMVSGFLIERSTTREDSIWLIVVQTDDLKSSSCLMNPPQMSFLLNGKAVSGRTNVYQDKGPQLPTDISRMLKYGTNIIQTIGYSSGNCIVALALLSKNSHIPRPKLKEYVEPRTKALDQDSEIFEGPSKVSLNCPISLKRIRRPVKGYLCKHLQCFDYDNFVEMNFVKPTWRCPSCNQPTSFMDLRIDKKLANILSDVLEDATTAIVSSDGTYKIIFDKDESQDKDVPASPEFIVNPQPNAIDLTTDEVEKIMETAIKIYETKPFEMCQTLPNTESLNQQPTLNHANIQNIGTLESLVPTSILNPIITNSATQYTRGSLPIDIGRASVSIQAHPINSHPVPSSHHVNTSFISQFMQNQSGMQQVNPTRPSQQSSSYLDLLRDQINQPLNQLISNTTSTRGIRNINPCHTNTTNTQVSPTMMISPSINISDATNAQQFHSTSAMLPGESVFDHYSRLLAYQRLNNQNWQPLGTMRGSLTGNSYNIAMNQYLNPSATNVNGLSPPTNWRHTS